MIQKSISLTTAAATVIVYLWSQLQPGGALFLFTSANILINLALIALAVAMVRISFIDEFKREWSYALVCAAAVACLLIGILGVVSSGVDYKFYSFFGPMDFLLLTEAGIIFALSALTYKHQPVKFRLPSSKVVRSLIPRPTIVLPRLAFHSLKHMRFG